MCHGSVTTAHPWEERGESTPINEKSPGCAGGFRWRRRESKPVFSGSLDVGRDRSAFETGMDSAADGAGDAEARSVDIGSPCPRCRNVVTRLLAARGALAVGRHDALRELLDALIAELLGEDRGET